MKILLGWRPRMPLEAGLADTVRWYLINRDWVQRICDGGFHSERHSMNENA